MEVEKYKLIYENKENINITRILGEEFVRNNKNKGNLIYNNKKYPLEGLYPLKNNENNNLKI